jgi:hypothetical protein
MYCTINTDTSQDRIQEALDEAERRVRELEAELRRLRSESPG